MSRAGIIAACRQDVAIDQIDAHGRAIGRATFPAAIDGVGLRAGNSGPRIASGVITP